MELLILLILIVYISRPIAGGKCDTVSTVSLYNECPVIGSKVWNGRSICLGCSESQPYHCARNYDDQSFFTEICAERRYCGKGYGPLIDVKKTKVFCEQCLREFINPKDNTSSDAMSECVANQNFCDGAGQLVCYDPQGFDVATAFRTCRCDNDNDYINYWPEKLENTCTAVHDFRCINAGPCPPSRDNRKQIWTFDFSARGYRCKPICTDGQQPPDCALDNKQTTKIPVAKSTVGATTRTGAITSREITTTETHRTTTTNISSSDGSGHPGNGNNTDFGIGKGIGIGAGIAGILLVALITASICRYIRKRGHCKKMVPVNGEENIPLAFGVIVEDSSREHIQDDSSEGQGCSVEDAGVSGSCSSSESSLYKIDPKELDGDDVVKIIKRNQSALIKHLKAGDVIIHFEENNVFESDYKQNDLTDIKEEYRSSKNDGNKKLLDFLCTCAFIRVYDAFKKSLVDTEQEKVMEIINKAEEKIRNEKELKLQQRRPQRTQNHQKEAAHVEVHIDQNDEIPTNPQM